MLSLNTLIVGLILAIEVFDFTSSTYTIVGRGEAKCQSIPSTGNGNCTRGWIDGSSGMCSRSNYANIFPCTSPDTQIAVTTGAQSSKRISCYGKRLYCLDGIEVPGDVMSLNLNNNYLYDGEQLKQVFNLLRDLVQVDVSSNNFVEIPEGLFRYNPFLDEVFFDRNFISYIPENTFLYNYNLTVVSFEGNRIQYLPWFLLVSNINLRRVNFRSNILTQFPVDLFYDNPLLESVDFSENDIEQIAQDSFSSNTFIRNVDFSSNNISDIPARLFEHSNRLNSLRLSFNQIQTIPSEFLRNCVELRQLYLSYNRIETLPEGWLRYNIRLTLLDLTGNPITVLPPALLNGKPQLTVIGAKDRIKSDQRNPFFSIWQSRLSRMHNESILARKQIFV